MLGVFDQLSWKVGPAVEAYDGHQFVEMDLHRRRSVLVCTNAGGNLLETARMSNDPEQLRAVLAHAGEHRDVVVEATFGWYWPRTSCPRRAQRCIWRTRWG